MENASLEKGTIEILHNSKPELTDPQFTELLMKRIAEERNGRIHVQFWLNYSLIAAAISLIIFLIVRAFINNPPVIFENHDRAIAGADLTGYGFFIAPLVALFLIKKLFDLRLNRP